VLVTRASGVLGRAAVPLIVAGGHEVIAPGHDELDLFDPGPGTGSETPAERYAAFGAALRIEDAATVLAAALEAPGGVTTSLEMANAFRTRRSNE
jgi:hypothetical protein